MAKKLSSKANYVSKRNIKSITVQRGKKTTEIASKNLIDGAYVKKGVKFGKGGNSNEDYYENLMVYVQGKGQIYQGTSMKKAIEKANLYMSKNPNSEIAIVDEKYGDEYDLDGNLKDEYAKGGSMKNKPKDTKRPRPNIRKNPKIVRTQFEEEEFEYGKGGNTNELKAKKRLEELRKELRAERISYSELVELQSLTKYIDKNDVELLEAAGVDEYRTGGVAGSKHVDVTKGYRLPHGYKAVKGDDKNKNYSKGKPKVRVTQGWRLPKGYEVVEAAYNMKYEDGGGVDISHYKVDGNIFIDYMDAISHCDKHNLPYSKIKKTMKYEDGGNMNDCYCYEIGGL